MPTDRKTKRSFSLSPESVEFLETLRQKEAADSVSAVLEDILQAARRAQELALVDKAVTDFYSSLSEEDQKEDVRWGEFALTQFPDQEA
jgi:hypothetical protein